jgi:hypothetical protein
MSTLRDIINPGAYYTELSEEKERERAVLRRPALDI